MPNASDRTKHSKQKNLVWLDCAHTSKSNKYVATVANLALLTSLPRGFDSWVLIKKIMASGKMITLIP